MENREFISAANLPEAEGSDVSVLVLENGELKQKHGGIGGGLTEDSVDIVIDFVQPYDGDPVVTLVKGSYNDVVEKIDNKTPVTAIVYTDFEFNDGGGQVRRKSVDCYTFVSSMELYYENLRVVEVSTWYGLFCILPDNTVLYM